MQPTIRLFRISFLHYTAFVVILSSLAVKMVITSVREPSQLNMLDAINQSVVLHFVFTLYILHRCSFCVSIVAFCSS